MPQLIYFVVMLVLSYALQPKPPKPKPAAFEDFDFPTADDGTPQIVVFGDVWLTDWTVIGVGNYRNSPIKKSSGGLFSKSVTSGYKYSMSLLMGLCRGIDDLIEIKVSDKTAWSGNLASGNKTTISIDKPNLFGGNDAEGGIVGQLIIQRGAADQAVLPELAAMYDTPVPAYRGVVTFFFDGLVCSNSPYPKPWSFRVRRITSNWDGSIWYPEKAVISMSDDKIKAMNPAHIIYEAQTNRVWGRGFAPTQLDAASFQAAADQLYSEGFGLCLAWRRQESLAEFIQQIVDTIGAAMFLDRLTGLWKLVLIRQNYDVATLPVYNNSNGLLNIVDDNNAANDISSNHTLVTFRDPITNQDQQIRAENIASIQKYGVISETKTYSGIPTQALAGRVAARDMKIAQSSLKKFKLEFDRRAYQMQPMSVFKINAPEQGIESVILRAVRVEHSDITNGKITVTAMQDVFGLADQNFIGNQPNLHQPPDYRAKQPTKFKIYQPSYYDLVSNIDNLNPGILTKDVHFYSCIAVAPTPVHLYFNLWIGWHRAHSTAPVSYVDYDFTKDSNDGSFCSVATLSEVLPAAYEQVIVAVSADFEQLKNVRLRSAVMMNAEILRLDGVNPTDGTITLSRGCIDSIIQEHEVGSELFFYDDAQSISSKMYPDLYGGGIFPVQEKLRFKVQSFTFQDSTIQPSQYDDHPELILQEITFTGSESRADKPYPPAFVTLNNQVPLFDSLMLIEKSIQTIKWRNRNRLLQANELVDQSILTLAIEDGCKTLIRIHPKNENGYLNVINHYAEPEETELLLTTTYPVLLTCNGADIQLSTVNLETVQNSSMYNFEIEFYGFGVNFGNHFGGINNDV